MPWSDFDYIGSAAQEVMGALRVKIELANRAGDEEALLQIEEIESALSVIESHSDNGDWEQACAAAEALAKRL